MQNWVIHVSRTRQFNISGSIYGSRLLAVNQSTDHIFSGKEVLLTSTATALWRFSDSERNKLSTNFHKFIGNIFGGVDLCPKNRK